MIHSVILSEQGLDLELDCPLSKGTSSSLCLQGSHRSVIPSVPGMSSILSGNVRPLVSGNFMLHINTYNTIPSSIPVIMRFGSPRGVGMKKHLMELRIPPNAAPAVVRPTARARSGVM